MYCKVSSNYQRGSNSAMKLNPPHELSRKELGYSCLQFFSPLPNAEECGMSLGCSEHQRFDGEATRTRMASAPQGSSSCGHLDRPTFGRNWVWQCCSLRGCFPFPHHSRISSCGQTALAGCVYGSAIRHKQLRIETEGRLLYLVPGEQHSPRAWLDVTGVGWQAGKTFLYPEHLGGNAYAPKRDWWTWPEAV